MSAARKRGEPEMASAIVHRTGGLVRLWECKECHNFVRDEENVAYHLVDRCLYGWCRSCYEAQVLLNRILISESLLQTSGM